MTEAVQIALIVTTPPTIVGLGAFILGWVNRGMLHSIGSNVDGNLAKMTDKLEKATDAILTLTGDSKYKDGFKEGSERK